MSFQSEGIYRIKGLIWLDDENDQFILQSVGNQFELTKGKAPESGTKGESVIVVIGKKLQRKGLEQLFTNALSD